MTARSSRPREKRLQMRAVPDVVDDKEAVPVLEPCRETRCRMRDVNEWRVLTGQRRVQLRELIDDTGLRSQRRPQHTIVERVGHTLIVTEGDCKRRLAVSSCTVKSRRIGGRLPASIEHMVQQLFVFAVARDETERASRAP